MLDSLGSVLNRISTIDATARQLGLGWASTPAPMPAAVPAVSSPDGQPGANAPADPPQPATVSPSRGVAAASTASFAHALDEAQTATSASTAPAQSAASKPPTAAAAARSSGAPAATTRTAAIIPAVVAPTRAPAPAVAVPASSTVQATATSGTGSRALADLSGTGGSSLPSYYPASLGVQPSMHGASALGPGTYTPAMELAQWQEIARSGTYLPNASGPGLSILPGTPRNPASQPDIDAGLAQAKARVQAAGVTDTQVQAAADALAQQLAAGNYAAAGGPGYSDVASNAAAAANYDAGWYQSPAAQEQLRQMVAAYDQAAAARSAMGLSVEEPTEVALARAAAGS